MKPFVTVSAAICSHACRTRPALQAFLHERAWALLSTVLQEEHGIDLSSLAIKIGAHGKPSFVDSPLQFNLSHCSTGETALVCCAVSSSPVGVDCAAMRPYDDRLARRICNEDEYAALARSQDPATQLMTLWTQKESAVKLTGCGLSAGLSAQSTMDSPLGFCTYQPAPGFVLTLCTPKPLHAPPVLTLK